MVSRSQKSLSKSKKDGYEKVLAVTISSGLSGTYNVVRLIAQQQEELEAYVLDTKNIGIGAGFLRSKQQNGWKKE